MRDSVRGWGRLQQLAVVLAVGLCACAQLGRAAEAEVGLLTVDTSEAEQATKQTPDSRASRAKRRGGTDVLRG